MFSCDSELRDRLCLTCSKLDDDSVSVPSSMSTCLLRRTDCSGPDRTAVDSKCNISSDVFGRGGCGVCDSSDCEGVPGVDMVGVVEVKGGVSDVPGI